MGKEYYDRYQQFKVDGKFKPLPFIKIKPKSSDKTVLYEKQISRMDKLSQEYYGTPYHGWLIMLANQQWCGMEFDIPDQTTIRIPFPFTNAIDRYILAVKRHKELYGE